MPPGRNVWVPRGSISSTFLPRMVSVLIASRLSVPMVLPPVENFDHDVVAVDLDGLDVADVHAGDAHLVAFVELAGVGELPVVAGLGEQHRARW